jgi:hypothetical protein
MTLNVLVRRKNQTNIQTSKIKIFCCLKYISINIKRITGDNHAYLADNTVKRVSNVFLLNRKILPVYTILFVCFLSWFWQKQTILLNWKIKCPQCMNLYTYKVFSLSNNKNTPFCYLIASNAIYFALISKILSFISDIYMYNLQHILL